MIKTRLISKASLGFSNCMELSSVALNAKTFFTLSPVGMKGLRSESTSTQSMTKSLTSCRRECIVKLMFVSQTRKKKLLMLVAILASFIASKKT